MKKTLTLLLFVWLASAGVVNAATVSLVYDGDNALDSDGAILAESGDELAFLLVMDFGSQITLGGGYDINWTPGTFAFRLFTSAGLGNPDFSRDPDLEVGRLFNGAVGTFNGLSQGVIARIVFAFTPGDDATNGAVFALAPSGTDGSGGPWIDAVNFGPPIEPDYIGVEVRVVPLPGAVWLLLSAVAAIAGIRRGGGNVR